MNHENELKELKAILKERRIVALGRRVGDVSWAEDAANAAAKLLDTRWFVEARGDGSYVVWFGYERGADLSMFADRKGLARAIIAATLGAFKKWEAVR